MAKAWVCPKNVRRANGREERVYLVKWREPSGRLRQKTFLIRREADGEAAQLTVRLSRSGYREIKRATVNDYVDRWGKEFLNLDYLKVPTITNFTSFIRKWLRPLLGDYPIASINESDINTFLKEMVRSGAAHSTLVARLRLLSRILGDAKTQGFRDQPPWDPKLLKIPRGTRAVRERGSLTPDEYRKILEHIESRTWNLPYRVMFLIACLAGLRRSEIAALTWKDIDFENCSINVNKTLKWFQGSHFAGERKRLGRKWDWDSPKSPRAKRTIDMSPTLKPTLRDHKLASPHSSPKDFVLAQTDGEPFGKQAFVRLVGLFRKAGVDRVLHECRNLYGSVLLSTGSDLYFVSCSMGHESTKTTEKIYAEQLRKSRPEDVARADAWLNATGG